MSEKDFVIDLVHWSGPTLQLWIKAGEREDWKALIRLMVGCVKQWPYTLSPSDFASYAKLTQFQRYNVGVAVNEAIQRDLIPLFTKQINLQKPKRKLFSRSK